MTPNFLFVLSVKGRRPTRVTSVLRSRRVARDTYPSWSPSPSGLLCDPVRVPSPFSRRSSFPELPTRSQLVYFLFLLYSRCPFRDFFSGLRSPLSCVTLLRSPQFNLGSVNRHTTLLVSPPTPVQSLPGPPTRSSVRHWTSSYPSVLSPKETPHCV